MPPHSVKPQSSFQAKKRYVFPPIWRETREDREVSVRKLLDGALEIITDAPILQMQAKLKDHRNAIADLRSRISELRKSA